MALKTGRQPIKPAKQKKEAKNFHCLPSPSTITYIGPPCISPAESFPLYIIAKVQVKYFVTTPTNALTHIQKTAPGPPTFMAIATPAILPIPTVAAKAVDKAS